MMKKGKRKKEKIKKREAGTSPLELGELLGKRSQGASNIAGIGFQLLYSVMRSFELFGHDTPEALIRLEGIEDVDLLGFRYGDRFVQVMKYQKNFTWSLLDEPLRNFVEAYHADVSVRFLLVLGGPVGKDLWAIHEFPNLTGPKLNRLFVIWRRITKKKPRCNVA